MPSNIAEKIDIITHTNSVSITFLALPTNCTYDEQWGKSRNVS